MFRTVLRSILLGCVLSGSMSVAPHVATPALAQGNPVAAYKKALQLKEAGQFDEAIRHAEKAERLAGKLLGRDSEPYVTVIDLLAELYQTRGLYDQAEPLRAHALKVLEKVHGASHPKVAAGLNGLATVLTARGRLSDAEPLLTRALAINEKELGDKHPGLVFVLNSLASLRQAQGRYAAAEPHYKRALAIFEGLLGTDHPNIAILLNNLAGLYHTQGRSEEAEPLFKRSLAINEKAHGKTHFAVAHDLHNLGTLYVARKDYAKAEPLLKRALAIHEKTFGKSHPRTANSLNTLASLYGRKHQFAKAETHFKRALAIEEKALGKSHLSVAGTLNNLAMLHGTRGRHKEAAPLLKRALRIKREFLGDAHPAVAAILHNSGLESGKQGQWEASYGFHRRAADILGYRKLLGLDRKRRPAGVSRSDREIFDGLTVAAWQFAERGAQGRRDELMRNAFGAAQLALDTAAGAALTQMAARFASGKSELAGLVRQRQDLAAHWRRQDRKLNAALAARGAERNDAAIAALRKELKQADTRLLDLAKKLETAYPAFAEIAAPRHLTIKQTQKHLASDEALLLYHVGAEHSFVWAVTKEGARWRRIDIGADALEDAVSALRRGLDPKGLIAGDGRGFRRDAAKDDRRFNLATAHQLYAQLLAPVEDLIDTKKHLLIVPSRALTGLPFHVLVTEKPDNPYPGAAGYRDAVWLVKRFATTNLPSVSSLKALRLFAKATRAEKPFVGFGDPDFSGAAQKDSTRGYASYFRGARADIDLLRTALVRLPDTADELHAIAKTLGVPKSEIRLRAHASEAAVKSAPLDRYRIVHFATHGLLAGEVAQLGGQAEPALAFSLPRTASDADDGLLTASEVAQLKLNADWVILSACNTAAGEKPGAEALSGLARAFFYSGARALLVSHWPVVSEAAVRLTTKTFAEMKAAPGLGRAEALRRSMLALIADTSDPAYGHPAMWAPFVVVGEGGERSDDVRAAAVAPRVTPEPRKETAATAPAPQLIEASQQLNLRTKAKSAVLLDLGAKTILFAKNADTRMAPANLTKLMTLAVAFQALKDGKLAPSKTLRVSKDAARRGGVLSGTASMFLNEGTQVPVIDLIKGMIVTSANDAALTLAEGLSGSEAAFVDAMNAYGATIGLTGTTFKNATGFPADGHVSTPGDLARLAAHIITTYPEHYALFKQRTFTFGGSTFRNRNPLVKAKTGADGLLTGFNRKQGYTFAASVKRKGRRMVAIVHGLKSPKTRTSAARALLDAGFKAASR